MSLNLETAGKILDADREEGTLEGEFWIEDDVYRVFIEEKRVYGMLKVVSDDLDGLNGYVNHHHVMTGKADYRSFAGTGESARLPENNGQLEAYVLKALSAEDDDLVL